MSSGEIGATFQRICTAQLRGGFRDDSVVDLFKTPEKFRVRDLISRVRARRRGERVSLWIDLTGNAVGALAIKCAGARSLAARVTRGGRSMIDHALPHRILENEYEN